MEGKDAASLAITTPHGHLEGLRTPEEETTEHTLPEGALVGKKGLQEAVPGNVRGRRKLCSYTQGPAADRREPTRLTDASPPTCLWGTDVSGCDAKFRRGLRLACLAEFSKLSKLYQKSSLSGEKGETLLG